MYARTTNRSRTRDKTGVMEIGRKSLSCVGVAVLGIGDMTTTMMMVVIAAIQHEFRS